MNTAEPSQPAPRRMLLAQFEAESSWAVEVKPALTRALLPLFAMRTDKQQQTYRSPLIPESTLPATIPPHVSGPWAGCPS